MTRKCHIYVGIHIDRLTSQEFISKHTQLWDSLGLNVTKEPEK